MLIQSRMSELFDDEDGKMNTTHSSPPSSSHHSTRSAITISPFSLFVHRSRTTLTTKSALISTTSDGFPSVADKTALFVYGSTAVIRAEPSSVSAWSGTRST